MATPGGLEPPTFSLEGCCSIQLSYGASVADFCATARDQYHGLGRRVNAWLALAGLGSRR